MITTLNLLNTCTMLGIVQEFCMHYISLLLITILLGIIPKERKGERERETERENNRVRVGHLSHLTQLSEGTRIETSSVFLHDSSHGV
jgi:hypothetical protein